jgi:hypothetical protein
LCGPRRIILLNNAHASAQDEKDLMTSLISPLMELVQKDPWRNEGGFKPELSEALEIVHSPDAPNDLVVSTLNTWVSKYQPCLFGRIAAKQGLIAYCLLRDEDLTTDEQVERKIQEARLAWKRLAIDGRASAFIVVLLSARLANAVPDETVKRIALRVCSLYLREHVEADRIHLERLRLEQPGSRRNTWEWSAGVNYFSAQGDRRWWQDHRFPAGMAFSVNSVGHMVKSGRLLRAMNDLEGLMGTAEGDLRTPKVDSLEKALELAMRTIALASTGPSGKATTLLPLPASLVDRPRCPVELPVFLADKDYCEYSGLYHTDYTVPSEYFIADVERPAGQREHALDFTYLFDDSLDNFDFDRMGEGDMIRGDRRPDAETETRLYKYEKRRRGSGTEVDDDDPELSR